MFKCEKQSYPYTGLDRPLGLQEVEAPIISRKSADEGGNTVSLMHRPFLFPEYFPRTRFYLILPAALLSRVDLASNRNEYYGYLLGVKAAVITADNFHVPTV